MSCRVSEERLVGFLLGELSRRGMLKTADHVGRCPDCLRELVALQEVVDALSAIEPEPAPEWLPERAGKAASAGQRPRTGPRRLRALGVPAIVGVACAVAILLIVVTTPRHAPQRFAKPTVARAASTLARPLPPAGPSETPPAAAVPPAPGRDMLAVRPPSETPAGTHPAGHPRPRVPSLMATVAMVYGRPEVRHGHSGLWRPLQAGDPVRPGDGIRTDLVSRVILAMPKAQRMCLNFDSTAEVTADGAGGRTIRLERGAFWARLRRGHDPFEVRTGAGTVRALGTEFAVESPHKAQATVTVINGEAELVNRYGTVLCKPGLQATMTPARAPSLLTNTGQMDIARYRTAWGTDVYQVAVPRKLSLEAFLDKLVGRRGTLGIEGAPQADGLLVTMVVPTLAAEQAGIRPGDLLVSVADRPVRSPKELMVVLGSLESGPTAPVSVRRDGAEQNIEVKLSREPWLPEASAELSDVFSMAVRGDVGEARSSCSRILAADPRTAAAHNDLGAIEEYGGDIRGAAQEYQKAVELAPRVAWYRYNLGTALRQVGNLDRSAEELRLALDLAPEWGEVHWTLGEVYVFARRLPDALGEAQRLREARGWEVWGDCVEGYALMMTGKLDDAVSVLKRATERYPFCPEAFRLLGNAALTQGEATRAGDALGRAMVLGPTDPRVYNSLCLVQCKLGDTRRAEQFVRKAIELDPASAPFYGNLGLVFYQRKDWPHAEEAYKRAIALQPEAPQFYLGTASVLAMVGRDQEAAKMLASRLQTDPGNVEAFQHVVAAYSRTWSLAGATALQEEAFAQDIVDPLGWRELEALLRRHNALVLARECQQLAQRG